MSYKVLITSDLHFGEYRLGANDSWLGGIAYPTFRLQQYDTLAQLMLREAERLHCQEIWLGGDLLKHPKSSPQIMYRVKSFLSTLAERIPVKTILGNHDLEVKSTKTEVEDYNQSSLITLMDSIPNLEVITSGVRDYGGVKVAFYSWRPLNKVPSQAEMGNADYLLCHGDVDKRISPFVDDLIPLENYRRVIAGHIHIAKDTEHFSSIGTPFPHSFSDDPHTSLLVLDLESNEVERISTENQFLKFSPVTSVTGDAVIRTEVPPAPEFHLKQDSAIQDFLTPLSGDAQAVIREVMGDNTLATNTSVDLSLKLERIIVDNFLSIVHLDYRFTEGIVVLQGVNGAGKSTLFRAIQYALFGKLKGYLKSALQSAFGKRSPRVELDFSYGGSQYKIIRDKGTEFYKDGKIIDAFSKEDLQDKIEAELPVLQFFDIIYVSQSSSGIFSDLSASNRVSLLSKLLGLDVIQNWTEQLESRVTAYQSDLKEIQLLSEKTVGKLEADRAFITSHADYQWIKIDPEMISQLQELANDYQNQYVQVCQNIALQQQAIKARENLSEVTQEYQALSQNPSEAPLKVVIPSAKTIDAEAQYQQSRMVLEKLEQERQSLLKHPDICPTCGQKWEVPNLQSRLAKLGELIDNPISGLAESTRSYYRAWQLCREADRKAEEEYYQQQGVYSQYQTRLTYLQKLIASYQSQLVDDTTDWVPKQAELKSKVEGLTTQIASLREQQAKAEVVNKIVSQRQALEVEVRELEHKLNEISEQQRQLEGLITELSTFSRKVLSDKGLLVAKLLEQLAEHLNSDKLLQVETIQTCQNGSVKPTLNIALYNEALGKYIDYQYLSGGQRLIADLRFLKGLVSSLALAPQILLLDEVFKFFDNNTILEASEVLRAIQHYVPSIYLILHGDLQQEVGDRVITVEMTNKGTCLLDA